MKELAELGVRQFVRNKMIEVLKEDNRNKSVNEIVKKMNEIIMEDFTKIAREESKKLIGQIGQLIKITKS